MGLKPEGGCKMRIHGVCAVILILPVAAVAAGIVSTIDAPDNDIIGLAWQDGHLWAVDRMSEWAYELDPGDGSVLFSFYPEHSATYNPYGLACGNDTLFINYGKAVAGGVPRMYDTSTGGYLGMVEFC